jgi:proline dehydrogenase
LPYLIRRAKENSAIAGQMSKEYTMISNELKRRRQQTFDV